MNIALIGPEGSGKKTFIELINSGIFKSELPSALSSTRKEQILLSPNKCGILHYPHKLIISTSSSLSQSHLLIIMYDCSNRQSYDEVISNYLPIASSHPNHLSQYDTIIIGNKVDIDNPQQKQYHFDTHAGIIYITISCKEYFNISSVINLIINTAVFPTKFIKNNELLFMKALTRIFHMMLPNKDIYTNRKIITKKDFALIHYDIFNVKLDKGQFQSIDTILSSSNGNDKENDNNNNVITLDHFITLNQLALQYDEVYLIWGFLRYYDYNNDLTIDLGAIDNEIIPAKGYAWDIMKEQLEMYISIAIEKKENNNKLIEDGLFCINENDTRINMSLIKKYFTTNTTTIINVCDWINKWKNISEEDWLTAYLSYIYIGNTLIDYDKNHDDSNSRLLWKCISIGASVGVISIGVGLLYFFKKYKTV